MRRDLATAGQSRPAPSSSHTRFFVGWSKASPSSGESRCDHPLNPPDISRSRRSVVAVWRVYSKMAIVHRRLAPWTATEIWQRLRSETLICLVFRAKLGITRALHPSKGSGPQPEGDASRADEF